MGSVIHIALHEDLPTKAQNQMRYRIEMGIWQTERRRLKALANANPDDEAVWHAIDQHDRSYEMVGLP